MSAATELAGARDELVLQPSGAPVRAGRLHLGRVRGRLPMEGPVTVVVAFALAAWLGALGALGAPGGPVPDLGRLIS